MAWKSGFFNSVNGDRTYNADQINDIFTGLITDGVYAAVGNKLVVQPNNGMVIQINTGRGWFNRRWVNNDSEYLQTLEPADVLLNRYCAVCVRVDNTEANRKAEPHFKYSEFATDPIKPTMERTETVKEYCLAYVYIKAGATSITAADIEDTRFNTELCGWVTGLIEQFDTNGLYEQWEAVFLDWFNHLETYLDENVEAKLVSDIKTVNEKVLKARGTLDSSAWSLKEDGVYTQTVTVNGINADSDIFVAPTDDSRDTYILMGCEVVSKGWRSVTFECTNPQALNIAFEIIIFNVECVCDVVVESVNEFTVSDDGNGAVTITA